MVLKSKFGKKKKKNMSTKMTFFVLQKESLKKISKQIENILLKKQKIMILGKNFKQRKTSFVWQQKTREMFKFCIFFFIFRFIF